MKHWPPIEREVCTDTGIWYLARLQPYRTVDNLIDGVVLTLADVTEHVKAIAARKALDLAEAIVDTVRDPLVVLDGALKIISANSAFHRALGSSREAASGLSIFELANHQWDFPAMHELLQDVLPRERSFEHRLVVNNTPGAGSQRLEVSARRIVDRAGVGELVLLCIDSPPAGNKTPH